MVFLQKHSEEIYWLQRRIDFIQRLDFIVHDDNNFDEMLTIANQYKKVESPSDLVDRLKNIYGNDFP